MLLLYSTLRSDAIGWLHIAVGWLHPVVRRLVFALRYRSTSYLLISHFLFHTAVNNIHLVLYGDLHVQQALALVAANEAFSEVLQLEFEPRVEGRDDEQPQVLQAAAPNPILNTAIMNPRINMLRGRFHPIFWNRHPIAPMCPALYA